MPQPPLQPAPLPLSPAAAPHDVSVRRIAPALHRQRWTLAAGLYRIVHLVAGQGEITLGGRPLAFRAPDLVWLPASAACDLQVEAGSAGVVLSLSDTLVGLAARDVLGEIPLRRVCERPCIVPAPDGPPHAGLAQTLAAIEAESARDAPGQRTCLAAQLTLLLVGLWRLGSQDSQGGPDRAVGGGRAGGAMADGPPSQDPRLLRFRHLVETQFRSRWSVAQYAAELGMTPDALHNLCVARLQRPPSTLVHQRMAREASQLLASTDLGVEKLAATLGFGSASHFSAFFKRWTGLSPRDWRLGTRERDAPPPGPGQGYADWP